MNAAAEFRFYEELNDLLPPERRKRSFIHGFCGEPAVKDAIEAIGVPHTEVDLILVNGVSVGFEYRLQPGDQISVYSVFEALDIGPVTRLRPQPLRQPKFVCDVHLGKLARRLRLLGFDVAYQNMATDPELVETALAEQRTILTQDRGILKLKRVTHGLGREICIRQGLKALVTGSIASLGLTYVIQLKAIEAQSSGILASEQVEAESKEEVVRALGKAVAGLRTRLGESLASIQKYDVPLEQATTSSLDALQAFSIGAQLNDKGQFGEALVHYKRATEIVPDFAVAYAHLAGAYGNDNQAGLMREAATRAFKLRRRTSERERLSIEVAYHVSETKGHVRTTVLNVMERLRQKGYLVRRKTRGVFHYSPRLPREELLRSMVRDFVARSLGGSLRKSE